MIKKWKSSMTKYKGKLFVGKYEFAKGDRIFQLYEDKESSKLKPVSYNSWQAAKKDGWSHDQE